MGLHHLERLGLAWNKGVTDDVIEQLCGATSNLRELDVGLCDKLTVRSLQVLAWVLLMVVLVVSSSSQFERILPETAMYRSC